MVKILWNNPGERIYEDGLDRGVLYPTIGPGVPWNGLISVEESSVGGDLNPLYFDGVKYLDVVASEDFQATLVAFAAPQEFAECDGSRELAPGLTVTQQPRRRFNLSYRTGIGNDLVGTSFGYKVHLVYNATADPASRENRTRGSEPEPANLSWTISTVPVPATTHKPAAHFVIDTRRTTSVRVANLEAVLYGTPSTNPRMPTLTELVSILSS